jgi:ubiquinone/menaquinone biosynthesis C-methylase UbiE
MSKRAPAPDYLRRHVVRSWKKESRNLEWWGLRDGMSVLDLGCGPGHFSLLLSEWLPSAKLTAADSDARMVQAARERLGDRATVVHAEAGGTTLPDNAFDFVIARLLFQHLADPVAVAREAFRVLKPGGRFVIIDIDDELFGVVDPELKSLPSLLGKYAELQQERGGNRHIARHLPRILGAAGFIGNDIESVAIHSDEAGLDETFPQLDRAPLDALKASGHLTRAEHAALRRERETFRSAKEPFALVLMFMACGLKSSNTP